MTRLLTSAAFVAFLSTAAIAADLPVPAEMPMAAPVAAFNWTGITVGIQGGYAWGDSGSDFSNGAPSLSLDPEGFFGGGHIGAAYQWNWLVLGIEGDIEGTDINGSDSSAAGATSEGSIDVNFQASARGRIGVAWNRAQLYATGGAAFADVDVTGGPLGGPDGNYTDENWGWTVGGGVDYAVTNHLIVGVEYRYTDFGDFSGNLAPPFPGVTEPADLQTQSIRGRVGWKFP